MTIPTRPRRRIAPAVVGLAALALPVLAGCTDNARPSANGDDSDPRAIAVQASDTSCTLSAAKAPSGTLHFTIKNTGDKVTEFYLLASDGLRIIGEVENIGPGLARDLVLAAQPGSYITACKPGMVGNGIRSDFAVSNSGEPTQGSADTQQLTTQATTGYAAYVKDQTEQLLSATQDFVTAYEAGDVARARALYPTARTHYERIEPVAESFGDLDPKLDLRQADLESGQKWTGWHRIEKDLWPPATGYTRLTSAQRKTYGQDLLTNTQTLYQRTRTLTFTVDQIANGSSGLLDEVAKSKVTGEEEHWSHTDLWDFQANIDGARVAYEDLQPVLEKQNPALSKQIGARFSSLQTLLDAQKQGSGWKRYSAVSPTDVKQLSDAVNALAEPVSKMAAAVL